MRPGHGHEVLSRRRGGIGDDLLPRLERHPSGSGGGELRMIGRHGGQSLGDRQSVDARTAVLPSPNTSQARPTRGAYDHIG